MVVYAKNSQNTIIRNRQNKLHSPIHVFWNFIVRHRAVSCELLYIVLNCPGLILSCIINDNSFWDCFLWQRDAYFGRSFFICSMTLCLCVWRFSPKSSFQTKKALPPTVSPYDLVKITVFGVDIPVSFNFLAICSDGLRL